MYRPVLRKSAWLSSATLYSEPFKVIQSVSILNEEHMNVLLTEQRQAIPCTQAFELSREGGCYPQFYWALASGRNSILSSRGIAQWAQYYSTINKQNLATKRRRTPW